AGLHADHITNLPLQSLIQRDEKIDHAHFAPINRRQKFFEQRLERQRLQKGAQFTFLERFITEWIFLGIWLEKKIKRVDDRHVRGKTDFQRKLSSLFVEYQA